MSHEKELKIHFFILSPGIPFIKSKIPNVKVPRGEKQCDFTAVEEKVRKQKIFLDEKSYYGHFFLFDYVS